MTTLPKDSEVLSRFIYKSSQINWDCKKPKSCIFSDRHPEGFSVFTTGDICEGRINQMELKYIRSKKDPKAPYGRCDLEARFYKEANLEIKKSSPPPRHYNIFGMPIHNDLRDANNLQLRQRLANENSKLTIYREK